jgi:hypothetical protein
MMPPVVKEQAPIPPPSYQRAQARLGPALHIDALTLLISLEIPKGGSQHGRYTGTGLFSDA